MANTRQSKNREHNRADQNAPLPPLKAEIQRKHMAEDNKNTRCQLADRTAERANRTREPLRHLPAMSPSRTDSVFFAPIVRYAFDQTGVSAAVIADIASKRHLARQ